MTHVLFVLGLMFEGLVGICAAKWMYHLPHGWDDPGESVRRTAGFLVFILHAIIFASLTR